MWETGVIVAIVMAAVAILSNVIAVTVFVVGLGRKIDVNHTQLTGKLDVMDTRVKNVEINIHDLKNTDRRLSLVEDRQGTIADRQGNMEKDNLLIRDDLGKLHQGLDRHVTALQMFNDAQFSKS
jgi:hypothetical protein